MRKRIFAAALILAALATGTATAVTAVSAGSVASNPATMIYGSQPGTMIYG